MLMGSIVYFKGRYGQTIILGYMVRVSITG